MTSIFQLLYAKQYGARSYGVFLVPTMLIVLFILVLGTLTFAKTDKVVIIEGEIFPTRKYVSSLANRGFITENLVRIGKPVRENEVIASIRMDDGAVTNILSPHNGVVVSSDLKNIIDGPVIEGTTIATVIDPNDFVLRMPIPPKLRGSIGPGTRVTYRFDTLTKSTKTSVHEVQPIVNADGSVAYFALAQLSGQHLVVANLGRSISTKMLITDISLLDYFLNF